MRVYDPGQIEMGGKSNMVYLNSVEQMDDGVLFRFKRHLEDYDNLKYMWGTGLRDKNGEEIYDGDIISWKDLSELSDGTLTDVVVVFWDDEYLRWSVESFNTPGECEKLYDYSNVDEIEIIGNIYENPELLEDENEG